MLSLQIKKRNTVRTIYIPFSPYWASKDASEQAQAEQRARDFYKPQNFRFIGDRTVYTRGQLTIYFGLDGHAFEGYSYDACLFARAPASEDFPNGRVIWNNTKYSVTTNSKHRYLLMRFASGACTGSRQVTEWYGTGADRTSYTHMQYEHAQWNQRCEVDNMPWRCDGDALRDEIVYWINSHIAGEYAVRNHQYAREQRARNRRDKKIASGKHLRLVKEAV